MLSRRRVRRCLVGRALLVAQTGVDIDYGRLREGADLRLVLHQTAEERCVPCHFRVVFGPEVFAVGVAVGILAVFEVSHRIFEIGIGRTFIVVHVDYGDARSRQFLDPGDGHLFLFVSGETHGYGRLFELRLLRNIGAITVDAGEAACAGSQIDQLFFVFGKRFVENTPAAELRTAP